MEYLGLGAEIAASIGIPIMAGYGVDVWLDSFPWATLGGVVMGLAAFIFTVVRISNRLSE